MNSDPLCLPIFVPLQFGTPNPFFLLQRRFSFRNFFRHPFLPQSVRRIKSADRHSPVRVYCTSFSGLPNSAPSPHRFWCSNAIIGILAPADRDCPAVFPPHRFLIALSLPGLQRPVNDSASSRTRHQWQETTRRQTSVHVPPPVCAPPRKQARHPFSPNPTKHPVPFGSTLSGTPSSLLPPHGTRNPTTLSRSAPLARGPPTVRITYVFHRSDAHS